MDEQLKMLQFLHLAATCFSFLLQNSRTLTCSVMCFIDFLLQQQYEQLEMRKICKFHHAVRNFFPSAHLQISTIYENRIHAHAEWNV